METCYTSDSCDCTGAHYTGDSFDCTGTCRYTGDSCELGKWRLVILMSAVS